MLFAGPPNVNTLYREFTDGRDSGTREVAPVYRQGRTVRFTNDVSTGFPGSAAWEDSRVAYLVHPSDPIIWWGSHLALNKPDWLDERRGADVLPAMRWFPLVTFWQVTADLPFATGGPSGHGHKYTGEYVAAWQTVLQPAGWTDAQSAALLSSVNR